MTNSKTILQFLSLVAFSIVLLHLSSCNDDDPNPEAQLDRCIAQSDLLKSYQALDTLISVSDLKLAFPDLADADLFNYDLKVVKITYDIDDAILSGLILIPETENAVPLLLYNRGSIFSNSDSPSELGFGLEGAAYLASKGAVTLLADFQGFGASCCDIHPYIIKEAANEASEGMIDATVEYLSCISEDYVNELYLAGYSEGGFIAAAFNEKFASGTYKNFEIKSTSIGGTPFNIQKTVVDYYLQDLDNSDMNTLVLAYLFESYNQYYQLDRTDIFNEPYNTAIQLGLFDPVNSEATMISSLPNSIGELLSASFISGLTSGSDTEFLALLKTNSIEPWDFQNWVYTIHGELDTVVPFFNSSDFSAQTIIPFNIFLTHLSFPEEDHETGGDIWLTYSVFFSLF